MNSAQVAKALRPRNATEEQILQTTREMLTEESLDEISIDKIARRAFVSRTNVYFYFPNKRAIVDRLIKQTFADIYAAAAIYLEGSGEPRGELQKAFARVVTVVNRDATVLLLAARLSDQGDDLPHEWRPYINRLVQSVEARIRGDQERDAAPADIPPRLAALALCAMVERHITYEVFRDDRVHADSIWILAELWWRAVYSRPDVPAMAPPAPVSAAPAADASAAPTGFELS
ncbi:TetR/AcrR family transcriptional regulator [Thermoleophilia bacterium SCSIO 60948]|nr:TetR/AcrR family transcriptional regulator [Thermoleophilia bacterium SCSIO 60948]